MCFVTASAGTAGTASDPLITRAYLDGQYRADLSAAAEARIKSGLAAQYDQYAARLQQKHMGYMAALGAGSGGLTLTAGYEKLIMPAGSTVELMTGGSFILLSGSVQVNVSAGTVLNVSAGTVVTPGGGLTVNQQYFCAEDTTAVFSAAAASSVLVDGLYQGSETVQDTPRFRDVGPDNWFYDAVSYVYTRGLFSGTSDTAFSPNSSMTRGMFVTVLYRLAGSPSVSSGAAFGDVADPAQYYYAPVFWANANGIVTGYQSGHFGPQNSVTREQMAVIMYRYAVHRGYSVTGGNVSAMDAFPDRDQISPGMETAMRWATANGIINGSDGRLSPTGTATRAHVAQIIMNFTAKYG